jgi:hypothetical protein
MTVLNYLIDESRIGIKTLNVIDVLFHFLKTLDYENEIINKNQIKEIYEKTEYNKFLLDVSEEKVKLFEFEFSDGFTFYMNVINESIVDYSWYRSELGDLDTLNEWRKIFIKKC